MKNTTPLCDLPDELVEVYNATVYVLQTIAEGTVAVDKLSKNKEGKLTRGRYVTYEQKQCTCMGWMKTDNCKHLRMQHDTYEAKGASSALVVDQIQTMAHQYPDIFPAGVRDWNPDLDDLPEKLGKINFSFPMDDKTLQKIVFVRKWPDKSEVVIIFENSPVTP